MSTRGEIFTTRHDTENRTYFFNVKENRSGDLFLNIVESNKRSTGFERFQIMVYAEDLELFMKKCNLAASVIFKQKNLSQVSGKSGRKKSAEN